MTAFRPPWVPSLNAIIGIPVCRDPDQPAGTVRFDLDPEDGRHIVRIWSSATSPAETQFTDEQREQIRDHYRAMDERAGRLLAEWRHLERFAAAVVPDPPGPLIRVTGI
ncbi:hypothetical protein [Verrucosispora sp. WMMC514]|uniref:hypothetical protein n=1 Tax=Verrucosispora sp. WMMC514 TaxID=3015156 RepID=UPI00248BBC77|nr:hypothetical protein [Verrucosispora sp. WMMC514]WBB94212.1 hypothetical protein O7597_15285 [Verrucosispora sp. WMMC514]